MDEHLITLIRRYVDGELTPDETTAIERRVAEDAEAARLVEFERTLRTHVASALRTETPAGLRDRVATTIREAPAVAGRIDSSPAPLSPRRASLVAIIATLALVAGAVLVGIFGPPLDRIANTPIDRDFVFDAAVHASREHTRCVESDGDRMAKAPLTRLDDAVRQLSYHLSIEIPRIDLEPVGFRFDCAGRCQVPGHDLSAHFMYVREDPPAMLSIFVVPDTGQFEGDLVDGLELGRWYVSEGGDQCRHEVLRATDGRLAYFIACCDPGSLDEVTAFVGEVIQVP